MDTQEEVALKEKLKAIKELCEGLNPYAGPLKAQEIERLESLGIHEIDPFKVTNGLLVMMDQTQSQLNMFRKELPSENE